MATQDHNNAYFAIYGGSIARSFLGLKLRYPYSLSGSWGSFKVGAAGANAIHYLSRDPQTRREGSLGFAGGDITFDWPVSIRSVSTERYSRHLVSIWSRRISRPILLRRFCVSDVFGIDRTA